MTETSEILPGHFEYIHFRGY